MSTSNVINSKKRYCTTYYEILLQRKLRKLVEHVDAIKPCRNGRILCLVCYQRNCICLEKTVQGKYNCKKTESRRKFANLIRGNECDNDGYDDEFNYYSSLIIPPASLLLRYIWAEHADEVSLLAARKLMKRMEKISKLNVHAWLQFLGDIDKDDNFSDNGTLLDDEELMIIIHKNINKSPIKRPDTETATGDKDDNKPIEINAKENTDENNNLIEVQTEKTQQ